MFTELYSRSEMNARLINRITAYCRKKNYRIWQAEEDHI